MSAHSSRRASFCSPSLACCLLGFTRLRCAAHFGFVPDKHQFLRGDVKADILEDVKSCHRALCSMIARIPRDLVPSDPANIWVTYGQGAVSRGLQKALCVLIDERIAADYDTARPHRGDKQRMTSCSARKLLLLLLLLLVLLVLVSNVK